MTKKKKIHWKTEYYLYSILRPKRAVLIRDIEGLQQQQEQQRHHDHHGVQTQAAYYCEIALKCLVAVLGEQPKSTHNLHTLYAHASQLYPGDLDQDIQTRIEKLAESTPVLKGYHFAKPSSITNTARHYYKKSRYPKAVRPGQWSEPQLVPNHLFAVGDGTAALTEEVLQSSSAAI